MSLMTSGGMLFRVLSLTLPVVAVALRQSSGPLAVQGYGYSTFAPSEEMKVPVVLGVMSKCPDALLCESVFDQVVKRASDKMDLTLSFIGKIDPDEPDFGVTCMHGPKECAGNVQELCAAKYAPDQWWSFLQCMNFQGRDKVGQPDVALKCAQASHIDWELSGVGRCAGLDGSGKGAEGVELLQRSVRASDEIELTTSCTVLINWRVACKHDGTWKECESGHSPNDFVRQINSEYEKLNGDN